MSKKETLHIYVRTSTDGQDVKRQIDMGKKFSEDMNMNHKIWNDEGKSGLKSFEDTREQLVELLWDLTKLMVIQKKMKMNQNGLRKCFIGMELTNFQFHKYLIN